MDSYPDEDTTTFARRAWIGPGGAATNYAVAVARFGHSPILVARAGEDLVRLGILDDLKRKGVDTSFVQVAKGEPPGIVVVIVAPRKSTRTMITVRGANEGVTGSMIPSEGEVVHFASVRGRVVRESRSLIGDRLATYDPGGEVYRDPSGVMDALYSGVVSVLYINDKELNNLIIKNNINIKDLVYSVDDLIIVVKKGRIGAKVITRGFEIELYPPIIHNPVDVTGAGDAFNAMFNICLINKCSIKDSLKMAMAAGAAKTLRRGGSNMPALDEVLEMAGKTSMVRDNSIQ